MVDLGKLCSALTSHGVGVLAAVRCPLSLAVGRTVSPAGMGKNLSLETFQEVFWVKIFCPRQVLHLALSE